MPVWSTGFAPNAYPATAGRRPASACRSTTGSGSGRAGWSSATTTDSWLGSDDELAAAVDRAEAIVTREKGLQARLLDGASLFRRHELPASTWRRCMTGARRTGVQLAVPPLAPLPQEVSTRPEFAHRAERVQPSAIREFLALTSDPRITSFAGGYPDATLFPMDELHEIYDDLLSARNASALQYTASDGLSALRALVAGRLTADGMPCTADDVLITQGGQQGLDLTAKLFIDLGDVIVTERPTFLGALIAFNPCEPDYRSVPMDEEGMDTDALERSCAPPSGSSSSTPFPTTRTRRVAR